MSLSDPPFESKIEPRYLNATLFSLCFFIFAGIIVIVLARHVLGFCPADPQSMSFKLVSPYFQFSLSTAVI